MDDLKPMIDKDGYAQNNLLVLRRRCNLTQRQFIDAYLTPDGKALVTVPKLSNIEHGAAYRHLNRILQALADCLGIPVDSFYLPTDEFLESIGVLIGSLIVEKESCMNSVPPLEKHPNAVQELVTALSEYLIEGMISGDFVPGYKLPSDRNMAKLFGVGRTAIREAIKVLNVLGLTDIRPGQGTFLASNSSNFFLTPLAWTFLMNKKDIESICQVRLILENETARLAAQNATDQQLDELSQLLTSANYSFHEFNYKKFLDLDIQFHLRLAAASGNQIIESLLLTIRSLMKHMSSSGMTTLDDMQAIYNEHQALFKCIVQKDPALAATKMREHLTAAYRRNSFQ